MPFHSFKEYSLHYESYGEGNIALLFIHGLYGDNQSWKYQIHYFREKYQIITVDLFGHGLSSKEVDPIFAPRIDAEAIVDLMKSRVGKQYFAVGHSFASSILPEIIKLEANRLKGIVFVDCTYQGDDEIIKIRVKFAESMLNMPDNALEREAEYWYSSLIGDNATISDKELILSSFRKGDHRWMFESVSGCKIYNEEYPPDKTPIRNYQPVFIMEAGSGAGIDFRKSWVNHFKNARYYLFENAGHFFFITEHERFNTLLDEFLNENL